MRTPTIRKIVSTILCLVIPLQSFAIGRSVYYAGMTFDEVIFIENMRNQQPAPGTPSIDEISKRCLSLIESTHFEAKKIYYSKRQFIDLVRKNPTIAAHIEKSLKLNVADFSRHLVKVLGEADLLNECVSYDEIEKFKKENGFKQSMELLVTPMKAMPQSDPSLSDPSALASLATLESSQRGQSCSLKGHKKNLQSLKIAGADLPPLMKENPSLIFPLILSQEKDKNQEKKQYRIRTYEDIRDEFRKNWRQPHLDEEDIRSLTDVDLFIYLANKFLHNYKTVSKGRSKGESFQESEKDAETLYYLNLASTLQGLEDYQNKSADEVAVYLAGKLGIEVDKYKSKIEHNFNIDFEDFIQNIKDYTPPDNAVKLNPNDIEATFQAPKILFNEANNGGDKHSAFGRTKYEIRNYISFQPLRDLLTVTKSGRTLASFESWTGEIATFDKLKLKTVALEDLPFLKKMEELKVKSDHRVAFKHKEMLRRLSKRKNLRLTQDPHEQMLYLEHKKEDEGLSAEEQQKYEGLRDVVVFGTEDYSLSQNHTKAHMTYKAVKKVYGLYNKTINDGIVDAALEPILDSSLKQLRPMSKNRARVYRLNRFLNGSVNISLTAAGYAMAPFTFGISVLVSNALKTGATGFFSMTTSLTAGEKFKNALTKAGAKTGRSFAEGLLPVIGDVNGTMSAVDDIRVALKIHEWFNRLRRGKNGVVKARWETLGDPLVLTFLRERLNYVAQGLLPRGKFLSLYGDISEAKRTQIISIVKDLQNAQNYLSEAIASSKTRYEYLLKSGKIPNNLLPGIIMALDQEEKNKLLAEMKEKEDIWNKMKEQALNEDQ